MLIKLPTHTTREGHDLRGCGKTVMLTESLPQRLKPRNKAKYLPQR
jgi:hypothetical protein